MGSENVARVGALGAVGKLDGLTSRAVLVLHVMASTSLDRDSPTTHVLARHYFAGWELLAVHLGYSRAHIEGPTGDVPKRAVARCMAELVAAGLIVRVGRVGSTGHRVWELTGL